MRARKRGMFGRVDNVLAVAREVAVKHGYGYEAM